MTRLPHQHAEHGIAHGKEACEVAQRGGVLGLVDAEGLEQCSRGEAGGSTDSDALGEHRSGVPG